jgi:transposase
MFIRKKQNSSGSISVQVLQKQHGQNVLLHSAGSSFDDTEISKLVLQAKVWVNNQSGAELDFDNTERLFSRFMDNIVSIKPVGTNIVLGSIFDEIGFDVIEDDLFRKLVLGRINYPVSKLKLVEYLARYEQYYIDEDTIYRYLDKIAKQYKRQIQQLSYNHTVGVLGHSPKIVFYDVTTLYFEIEQEDELRKTGFSKDGKHQHPQIVLGLLVSKGGYPLGYEIFQGNKYEGYTMLPILNYFKRTYKLEKIIVIADSGLMSKKNLDNLIANKYTYIIGARIKNENDKLKQEILSLPLKNNEYKEIIKGQDRLIIGYSDARARKDAHNRQRGITKLEKEIKSGKLTKDNITNKGYKKFLDVTIEGNATIEINKQKIEEDKKWDGLKGYATNTALSIAEVVDNYKELWIIEKAFRINKNDIKIRPIYHRLPKRIEAHICICFAAYKIIKELERQLKDKEYNITPNRMLEIAQSLNEIEVRIPTNNQVKKKILFLTEEHQLIKKWMDEKNG